MSTDTILAAAREHLAHRGYRALVDAYALHLAAGGRGSDVYLARAEKPHATEALAWLDECLGRPATMAERRYYAAAMRVEARVWTGDAAADAMRHGEVSVHLTGALYDDSRRDWGTSTALPELREARAEADRARLRVEHEERVAAAAQAKTNDRDAA